jgi:dolichol-phosphate mannosyltransferase
MVKVGIAEKRTTVCIVIPVCNEAASLPMLSQKLADLHRSLEWQYQLEYCFVDDGSTDATPLLARSVPPFGSKCTVLSHVRNLGVGAAFRTGFAHANADIVCTIDADCSYSPSELRRLLEPIARDEADVVVASPYHPDGAVEGVQRWRVLLSLQCSRLYRVVSPLKLHTYTSIFRAYRGSIVPSLAFPSNGFVSAVEILLSAAALGYRVREIPATLTKRAAGCSKMRLLGTVRTHAQLLVRCLGPSLIGNYPLLTSPSEGMPEALVVARGSGVSSALAVPISGSLAIPLSRLSPADAPFQNASRRAQA